MYAPSLMLTDSPIVAHPRTTPIWSAVSDGVEAAIEALFDCAAAGGMVTIDVDQAIDAAH